MASFRALELAGKVALRVLPFVVALGAFAVWLHVTPDVFTGDEPHYLVVADSIVTHHTLDMRASYADPHGVRRFLPGLVADHGVDPKRNGHLVPVPQGLALPVLMAPVWSLTHSLLAVRLWMIVIAAAFAHELFRLLADLDPDHWVTRCVVWAGACFTVPIVMFSNQLYPEVPAALLVTLGLRAMLRVQHSRGAQWALGFTGALLPWFHLRFTVIAAGLVLTGAVLAAHGCATWRERAAASAPVLVPSAAAILLLLVQLEWLYGMWQPTRVFALVQHAPLGSRLGQTYRLVAGSLLSPSEGLAVFAPVFLLGLVGIGAAVRARGWAALALALTTAVYLVGVVPLVHFGTDPPARFVIVLVPFLAVAGFYALVRAHWLRTPAVALAALSLVALWSVRGHYVQTYIEGAKTQPSHLLASVLPWTDDTRGADHVMLPDNTIIGGVAARGANTVMSTGADTPVLLASWQPVRMRAARYDARMTLNANTNSAGPVVRLVAVVGTRPIASHDVDAANIRAGRMQFSFHVPHEDDIVRVDAFALTTLHNVTPHGLDLRRVGPAAGRNAHVVDQLPVAALWLLVLVGLSVAVTRSTAQQVPVKRNEPETGKQAIAPLSAG